MLVLQYRKNRSVSVVQLGRSTTKFSTTTNATGMPVLENEPMNRARSLALRDVSQRERERERGGGGGRGREVEREKAI